VIGLWGDSDPKSDQLVLASREKRWEWLFPRPSAFEHLLSSGVLATGSDTGIPMVQAT
jgi:hypothetical protein